MWQVPAAHRGAKWNITAHQRPVHANVARSFADWGIPTADSLLYVREAAPDLPLIASGGLRDGVDIAKCIALGADLGGIAGPFLKAADQSLEDVRQLIWELAAQIRIAMFASGAADIAALKQTPLMQS